LTADRAARLPALRASLQPVRQALASQPYLGGDAPDYADCIVLGAFMWARSVSPLPILEPADVIFVWRDRMLDQAGGMARRAPCFGA
jgi:glutathione S-transferase